mgnify:CR=1 FL=1
MINDGSPDIETGEMLKENQFKNLDFFKVDENDRGLTRQRNFGIDQLKPDCEIVCFLDDDVILEKEYFKELLAIERALRLHSEIFDADLWPVRGNQGDFL